MIKPITSKYMPKPIISKDNDIVKATTFTSDGILVAERNSIGARTMTVELAEGVNVLTVKLTGNREETFKLIAR